MSENFQWPKNRLDDHPILKARLRALWRTWEAMKRSVDAVPVNGGEPIPDVAELARFVEEAMGVSQELVANFHSLTRALEFESLTIEAKAAATIRSDRAEVGSPLVGGSEGKPFDQHAVLQPPDPKGRSTVEAEEVTLEKDDPEIHRNH